MTGQPNTPALKDLSLTRIKSVLYKKLKGGVS